MTKVAVDDELCQGHRQCSIHAPDLMHFDDAGAAHVREDAPPLDEALAARLVEGCPAFAISIVSDEHD